jgi:hypothetical protein
MPAIAPAASRSPAMTFAAMIRLLIFELLEQLGPKNVLLNVSRDFEPHAIASD